MAERKKKLKNQHNMMAKKKEKKNGQQGTWTCYLHIVRQPLYPTGLQRPQWNPWTFLYLTGIMLGPSATCQTQCGRP